MVSGSSGSGKSTAIRALEDIGFYCIDNLPVVLLGNVVELCERAHISQVAVCIDVRELSFLADYQAALGRVEASGYSLERLFLTASDDLLIRRFKETRRRHPLQGDGTIEDGIRAERAALASIREQASHLLDTSTFTVHDLRKKVQAVFAGSAPAPMNVQVMSFGFKHGFPREADYVFDVRVLANPYFVEALRKKSGLDSEVAEYVMQQEATAGLLDRIGSLLDFVLPRLVQDGRSQVTIAIGCTGGQHRSVAVSEWLASRLSSGTWRITTLHRDVVHS